MGTVAFERYDDLQVTTYRKDGSLRYEIRQRNYSTPTNVVTRIVDERTEEEARRDWETRREMGLPIKSEPDSIYTYGFTRKARSWAGDDRAYLTLTGLSALLSGLRPLSAPRSRQATLGVGSDWGASEPLRKASRALGAETTRREATERRITRYDPDDGLSYEATFQGLGDTVVYEVGLFLGEPMYCRHVLYRPVHPDHEMKVTLTFVVV